MATKGVLPKRHRPGFLLEIDRRTALAQRLATELSGVEADLGGTEAMSTAERSLAERAVWLTEVLRQHESRLAKGGAIDLGAYVRGIQALTSLYRTLGLRRRARDVASLASIAQEAGTR